MRIWLALAIIASLAWPAFGQTTKAPPGPTPGGPPKTPHEIEADKAADRAYQKSLKIFRINRQPTLGVTPAAQIHPRRQPSRSPQRKRLRIRGEREGRGPGARLIREASAEDVAKRPPTIVGQLLVQGAVSPPASIIPVVLTSVRPQSMP